MTLTNDEYREVAERMRINAKRTPCVDRDALRYAIGLAPFVVDDDTTLGEIDESDSEIWGHLADLIDRPTCHMYETDHEYEDSVRCDRCQMTFMRPWVPFKYCPECGARVVSDDE